MATISLTLPSDGQTIDASDVNNPFNTIAAEINGNLDNSNIKAGAAIERSKIAGFTDGWESLGYAPTTITALGNRSYTVLVPSVDTTSATSVGQRLKLPRTVTAPTQCTSLNGTTQYYNDTSVSGMTFTDDFTVSAWVKLSSYGTTGAIASRYNGTSGWAFFTGADGIVYLRAYNAAAGNYSQVYTYQSVPLNKWVHLSAQLDMSTFTATTTTSYVMVDGKDVPAQVARAGTNPTALVQAGNLEIGSMNGGTNPFPGKIAQVAIYSAKVTQATILASMNQALTGSETSLISAYSFNNSINDLNTTNANNLTAQGSAVATTADSCFTNAVTGTSVTAGTTNYGIITAQTFSTNTTYTVQIPEGETLPTTGGIGTISYSTQKTPYGFPGMSNILYKFVVQSQFTSTSGTLADVTGLTFTAPYIPINKEIRVMWHGIATTSVANNGGFMGVTDTTSGVALGAGAGTNGASGDVFSMDASSTYTTSASGTRSYKIQLARGVNAATVTLQGSVANPAFVTVELTDSL
jgi:hypothetical protein